LAIAKRSTDLWGYVQRAILEDAPLGAPLKGAEPSGAPQYYSRTVRLIAPPTVALRDPLDWHSETSEAKAGAHLDALQSAVAGGRSRRAARHRTAYLQCLHSDRVAKARSTADMTGLRLDPMGRGPVLDRPTLYYRDRLPWTIVPVSPYRDDRLPPRAGSIVEEWNSAGELFDAYYLADEPRTTCFPTQSLIGVVTTQARTGDWFILDRWAG
jgi:hypothetical protein